MNWLLIILLSLVPIFFPFSVSAEEQNQFITLINPIRISRYSSDPVKSLTNQYSLVKTNELSASWLLTYDTFTYPNLSSVVKTFDNNQDIGILLEVTENSAKAAGINYNKTDSWHRSTSVFLTGYSQADRIKFIDFVFNKFKAEFGYYPTSVGAWWIDSFSLDLMQKSYGVNANLVVADQLETDGYTIWGQPWEIPYYPSKNHAAIPAQTKADKLAIVNMQWAPRDPLNGYLSPNNLRASLYSTQDYPTIPLSDDYLEKLINLYAKKNTNSFGQITLGLEGDFPPDSYLPGGQYEEYLLIAKKVSDQQNIKITNMQQFSQWYQQNFSISPAHLIQSDDLLGKNIQSIWYQSPRYRIGLVADNSLRTLRVVDFRSYQNNFQEPFFLSTNKQLDLYIKLPSVIDLASFPTNPVELKNIDFKKIEKNEDSYLIFFDDEKFIKLETDKLTLENFGRELQAIIPESPYLKITKEVDRLIIEPSAKFPYDKEGLIIKELNIESIHFLKQKKAIAVMSLTSILIIILVFSVLKIAPKKIRLIPIIFLIMAAYIPIQNWYSTNSENYFVSQAEIDSLITLKQLQGKRVLVLDKACLQCNFKTQNKVASLSNRHGYINKISNKEIVLDKKLIESHAIGLDSFTQLEKEQAKKYLKDLVGKS